MTPHTVRRRTLLALVVSGVLLSACSGSVSTETAVVPSHDVETQAAEQLAESIGSEELPDISCPEDLDGEEGATMTCELTSGTDPAVYPVEIEVTSVDEETDKVLFDVDVGEALESE